MCVLEVDNWGVWILFSSAIDQTVGIQANSHNHTWVTEIVPAILSKYSIFNPRELYQRCQAGTYPKQILQPPSMNEPAMNINLGPILSIWQKSNKFTSTAENCWKQVKTWARAYKVPVYGRRDEDDKLKDSKHHANHSLRCTFFCSFSGIKGWYHWEWYRERYVLQW